MIEIWLYTIISLVVVSVVSFSGIFLLSLNKKLMERLLLLIVSFAIGALLGNAFLHLLPEAEISLAFGGWALTGTMIFFGIEKFLRWQHRHLFLPGGGHPILKPYIVINLIGDGIHNFIDGMVVAGSYLVSVPLGVTTTLAVIVHEGAQELGDFAILIKGGLSHSKALFYNFLSAIMAILGGVTVLLIGSASEKVSEILVPITIGGFLYLALASLVPELHHEETLDKLVMQAVGIGIGIAVMAALLLIE